MHTATPIAADTSNEMVALVTLVALVPLVVLVVFVALRQARRKAKNW